jgi:hypothetical protein
MAARGYAARPLRESARPALVHAFYDAVQSPKQELWPQLLGHIDFYDDLTLITAAADAIGAFYSQGCLDRPGSSSATVAHLTCAWRRKRSSGGRGVGLTF